MLTGVRGDILPDMNKNKGIALIAIIAVITFVAITVFATASYVLSDARLTAVRAAQDQAYYAAWAGIYAAIDDYVTDGRWSTSTNVPVGNGSYTVGARDADFLLIDAAALKILRINNDDGNVTLLDEITIQNTNPNKSITISSVRVDFSGFPSTAQHSTPVMSSLMLKDIWVCLSDVGNGQTRSISPFTLLPGEKVIGIPHYVPDYAGDHNQIYVTGFVQPNGWFNMTFFLSDGSSRTARILPRAFYQSGGGAMPCGAPCGDNGFIITSTGRCGNASVTLEATYDIGWGKGITSWRKL